MPMRSLIPSVRRMPRWAFICSVLLGLTSLVATGFAAGTALADPWWSEGPTLAMQQTQPPPATQPAPAAQPSTTFEPFDAVGLPAGSARGVPSHATLPPGFSLKHVHGGPSYGYVIWGSFDIIDATDGSSVTYNAGDFFWEPVGHVHTARSTDGAELFIMRFLAPRAEGTITVQ